MHIPGPGTMFMVYGFTGTDGYFTDQFLLKGNVTCIPIRDNLIVDPKKLPETHLYKYASGSYRVECVAVGAVEAVCEGKLCDWKTSPCVCCYKPNNVVHCALNFTFVLKDSHNQTVPCEDFISECFQHRYICTLSNGGLLPKHISRSIPIRNIIRNRVNEVLLEYPSWIVTGWAKPGQVADGIDAENGQKPEHKIMSEAVKFHIVSMKPQYEPDANTRNEKKNRILSGKIDLYQLYEEERIRQEAMPVDDTADGNGEVFDE